MRFLTQLLKSFKSVHYHGMVFTFTTFAAHFEAISPHLMSTFLTCANAIRKIQILIVIICSHVLAMVLTIYYIFPMLLSVGRVSKVSANIFPRTLESPKDNSCSSCVLICPFRIDFIFTDGNWRITQFNVLLARTSP